jgi:hypothetical protein
MNYGLLAAGTLDPPSRVVVQVIIDARPQVLIDGIITEHEVIPSNEPGRSVLSVKGLDISQRLALEERTATYRNQSDSEIVGDILKRYGTYGLRPDVERTTDTPSEAERTPVQHGTDLAYVRALAERNGFVFYVEPAAVPGSTTAYWGRERRSGQSQPALTMNMGAATNVDVPMRFRFDALGPATPQLSILDPTTRMRIPIPLPDSLVPALGSQAATPLRTTIASDTANLSLAQALLRALTASGEGGDAIIAQGELDAVRYGQVLRARRLVDVRGVGTTYGGRYYVQKVRHAIRRGRYTQRFWLRREGRGAAASTVTT